VQGGRDVVAVLERVNSSALHGLLSRARKRRHSIGIRSPRPLRVVDRVGRVQTSTTPSGCLRCPLLFQLFLQSVVAGDF